MVCTNITLEKVRAEISFGNLIFETPDVKSFSVSRSRGQLAATFSASIEVPATTVFPLDQDVVIRAGIEGDLDTIFTGVVKSVTVNPSFERATTYIVNMSGADRLQELEGKTISRRQRARAASTFAAITGVSSKRPQKGISTEKRKQSGGGTKFVNPDTNMREHSKIVRTDRITWDPFKGAKDPEAAEGRDEAAAQEVIDIKPKSVALSPGVGTRYVIDNATYQAGDSWSVSDPSIGGIVDQGDGSAIYTQFALGENTVQFNREGSSEGSLFIGKATAVGIPIHDHSSLGQGGPAFGVYGSD